MAKAPAEDQEEDQEEPQEEWREEKLQKEFKEQDQIAQVIWNGKDVNNEIGQDTNLPCDALQDEEHNQHMHQQEEDKDNVLETEDFLDFKRFWEFHLGKKESMQSEEEEEEELDEKQPHNQMGESKDDDEIFYDKQLLISLDEEQDVVSNQEEDTPDAREKLTQTIFKDNLHIDVQENRVVEENNAYG